MNVLVINAGSSSLKYQLFDMDRGEKVLCAGGAERVGAAKSLFYHKSNLNGQSIRAEAVFPTHGEAISAMLSHLLDGCINSMEEIKLRAEQAAPELEEVANMLPDFTVHTQVLLGSAPGVVITEYAREIGAAVIFLTRSSRGPLRKMGSVANYLVKNATFLDVFVMREDPPAEE